MDHIVHLSLILRVDWRDVTWLHTLLTLFKASDTYVKATNEAD